MNLGLCCLLYNNKHIKFKTYTWKNISSLSKKDAINKILNIWDHNIHILQLMLNYCKENNFQSYRVSSDLFPHFYNACSLLNNIEIQERYEKLTYINSYDIKLSMHPGQFVNIGSPNFNVIRNSMLELQYHLCIAKYLNIYEINIHCGGAYNDIEKAKHRFIFNLNGYLSKDNLSKITLENDELSFSPYDTLDLANALNIRATLDIHHMRCNAIKNNIEYNELEIFKLFRNTWHSYDYQRIHISSPKNGYSSPTKSRPHSDYININDVPLWLLDFNDVHIDIEAKHKELAIFKLRKELVKIGEI